MARTPSADGSPPPAPPVELPVLPAGDEPPRRADAVRNRELLLCAARRLTAERGADAVTMDAVAVEAGVGKGTLFRRFGDRGGLFRALLQDGEQAFQEAFLTGPPPLGPGAPAADRLQAFGRACIDLVVVQGAQVRAAMEGPESWALGPLQVRRLHVLTLLREAAPELDADVLADVLVSAFSPRTVLEQHELRGLPVERLHAAWDVLVARVCAA